MNPRRSTDRPSRNKAHIPAMAVAAFAALALLATPKLPPAQAYPPAVGILGKTARNCLACHVDNGPWKGDSKTIIDILEKETGKSLLQEDGTFRIRARRGERKTVLTVIGRAKEDTKPKPHRNAWLYVDPTRIKDATSLSVFARGWNVNLPMSCRLVGDSHARYPEACITVLPMTVRPGDDAQDAELELQVMLTKGESVKGTAKKGLTSNYFERKVRLIVEKEPAPRKER